MVRKWRSCLITWTCSLGLLLVVIQSLATSYAYIKGFTEQSASPQLLPVPPLESNIVDFANPALMETKSRAVDSTTSINTVKLLDETQLNYTHKILILTPISNAESSLRHYFELINRLTYPHWLISVVLGEDSSSDQSYKLATELIGANNGTFSRMELLDLHQHIAKQNTYEWRHSFGTQRSRRAHLAKARNRLLFSALKDDDYVLWIDVDVGTLPVNVIEAFVSASRDIVVPGCYYHDGDGVLRDYDRNTWKETELSRKMLSSLPPDELVLEGYDRSHRLFASDLRSVGDLVQIDSVGGCVLFIKADLHRNGLVFPPFVIDHQIETEGLGRLAARMNYEMFIMPNVVVVHS